MVSKEAVIMVIQVIWDDLSDLNCIFGFKMSSLAWADVETRQPDDLDHHVPFAKAEWAQIEEWTSPDERLC